MSVRVRCPSCGQAVAVPVDRLGTVGRCPKCSRPFRLPDAALDDEVTRGEPLPPEVREPPPRHRGESWAAVPRVVWLLYLIGAAGLVLLWLLSVTSSSGAGQQPGVHDTLSVCLLVVTGYTVARAVEKLCR